ncbi:MAG: amidohydrolase family protein [Actinobacteria bacterium]|nr:amidohydrolase family protein [Actinomycetota bacterium]
MTSRPTPSPRVLENRRWLRDLALAVALTVVIATVGTGAAREALDRGPELGRVLDVAAERAPQEEGPAEGPLEWVPAVGGRQEPTVIPQGHRFDVVIESGRVMDPATGFDHVANVGIDDGAVVAITEEEIRGRKRIDSSDRVVAPGFIDILSYEPNQYGVWYKIGDGVTANLGMHGLNSEADDFFRTYEGRSPAHFGGAWDHAYVRGILMDIGVGEAATKDQIQQLKARAEQGLKDGWMGIDFELEYAPGTSYEEVVAIARLAKRYNVPVFFHGRYSDMQEPGTNIDTLNEIIDTARDTGAPVHVEHINSTGGTFSMKRSLKLLERARAEGLDVTACTYPYNFWATSLASERFADGWQERFQIDYGDLAIPGTGERLTAQTFATYKAQGKIAAAFAIPEDDIRGSLESDFVMIGSDGILESRENNNHPRSAGTFARVLGRYVREERLISLMGALSKMTIQPARRLQAQAPAMRTKGRLQVGADADITIFDPATVKDKATLQHPNRYSEGIDWVLVMGTVVKSPGRFFRSRNPGLAVKGEFSNL